ncbi:hypothetical protein SFRURICE_010841 [Spodoptera frugiperda]|nr:hypothetical protein SFRURICE_010841 [Spodoptera frugiperda]
MDSNNLFILLVLYISEFSGGQPIVFRPDYTYIAQQQSFYKVHLSRMSWFEAKRMCVLEDASLFYPQNEEEAKDVLSFITHTAPTIPSIYLSLNDLDTKGMYQTIDGKPISDVYHKWSPGEPNNNNGEEDCVVLILENGLFNDGNCNTTEYFVCKKPLDSRSNMSNSVGQEIIFRPDYTYIAQQQSFYKVHLPEMTWFEAKRICALEDASLFYPQNEEEAKDVLLFIKDTDPMISSIYLSLNDLDKKGVFKTIDAGQEIVFRPDYTYIAQQQSFYKVHLSEMSWFEAKRMCALEEASLFYPENEKEAKDVLSFIQNTTQTIPSIYLSLNDLEIKGVYQTIDGKPISDVYNKWSPGEPNNNKGEEDCVVLILENGLFNDGNCNTTEYFVCKKLLYSVRRNSRCNMPNSAVARDTPGVGDRVTISNHRRSGSADSEQGWGPVGPMPNPELRTTLRVYRGTGSTGRTRNGVHLPEMTWFEAKRICALEDASLFYPQNEEEAKDVLLFIKNTKLPIHSIYLSLNDLDIEGVFKTIDGNWLTHYFTYSFYFTQCFMKNQLMTATSYTTKRKPISDVYNKWGPGEPNNNKGEEDCVVLFENGQFNDVNCNNMKHFVCKKPLEAVTWNSRCNMSNSGYIFSEETGNCYKLHTKPLNWIDAYATCLLERTTLAVIDSPSERDFLANLAIRAATHLISETYQKGIFHLGFHNRHNTGWTTVRGNPIVTDNEYWWGGHYPGEECNNKCGGMFYDGYLVNNDCEVKSFFICEHQGENHVGKNNMDQQSSALVPEVILELYARANETLLFCYCDKNKTNKYTKEVSLGKLFVIMSTIT